MSTSPTQILEVLTKEFNDATTVAEAAMTAAYEHILRRIIEEKAKYPGNEKDFEDLQNKVEEKLSAKPKITMAGAPIAASTPPPSAGAGVGAATPGAGTGPTAAAATPP